MNYFRLQFYRINAVGTAGISIVMTLRRLSRFSAFSRSSTYLEILCFSKSCYPEKYVICSTIFMVSGRYFDGHGNRNNWWQNASAQSFNKHAQCFIDQYTQYHVNDKHINGLLTLDENVSDQL